MFSFMYSWLLKAAEHSVSSISGCVRRFNEADTDH